MLAVVIIALINNLGGNVIINLTRPIIHELAKVIAKDDIIGVYANGGNESIVEFAFAHPWLWQQVICYYST